MTELVSAALLRGLFDRRRDGDVAQGRLELLDLILARLQAVVDLNLAIEEFEFALPIEQGFTQITLRLLGVLPLFVCTADVASGLLEPGAAI